MESADFGIVNYTIFGISLGIAVLVGVYQSYKDKNNHSLSNFFYADKLLSPIPIGISMAVTFVSSLTVLGFPPLAYDNGTVILWMSFAGMVQLVLTYLYFIPFLHTVKLASAYEYLEMRFDTWVRKMASLFQLINQTLYMSVAVYLTSLALEVVAPIPFHWGVIITCSVCTFYTVLGGIKAVIWVDFFQAFIMIFGCFSVFITTCLKVGGINKVWMALERGNRTNFATFNPDPTFTYSAWTIVFGLGINWAGVPICSQTIVQRLQSCKSERDAKKALMAFGIVLWVLLLNSALNGVSMYAYFEGCDPLRSGKFKDRNQYVPYLVVQLFENAPGMAGLFVSAAYSGMLSTVSSGQNALSNMVTEDFVRPFIKTHKMSEKKWVAMSKMIGCALGILIMCGTFLFYALGDTIAKLAFTIDGIITGPIFGLFLAGLFLPWVTTKGAACGFLCAILTTATMSIGRKVYGAREGSGMDVLPPSVETCANFTAPTMSPVTVESSPYRPAIADTLFSVSYFYYGLVGTFMCTTLSLVFSLIIGKNDPKKMNPLLFVPLIDNKRFPEKTRKFFRFGVPCIEEKEQEYIEGDALKINTC